MLHNIRIVTKDECPIPFPASDDSPISRATPGRNGVAFAGVSLLLGVDSKRTRSSEVSPSRAGKHRIDPRMKHLFVLVATTIFFLVARQDPALAETAWFMVQGYALPPTIVAGPYSNIAICTKYASEYGDNRVHCDFLVYDPKVYAGMDDPPPPPATAKPAPQPTQ